MKKVIVRIVLMALIVTAISAAALTATAEWKITSSPFRLPKIILKTPVEEAEENAAEEATPEEAIAEEATPAEATPEEATAEEATSDEANDTEKKTEEELPEEDQKETSSEQDISKEENIEITESDETVAEEMIARTGMVVLQQNEAYLIVYEEANEESEELGQIQGGELIEVLQISESWSLIRYNEMTGYVKSEKIALLKYSEDEEEELIIEAEPIVEEEPIVEVEPVIEEEPIIETESIVEEESAAEDEILEEKEQMEDVDSEDIPSAEVIGTATLMVSTEVVNMEGEAIANLAAEEVVNVVAYEEDQILIVLNDQIGVISAAVVYPDFLETPEELTAKIVAIDETALYEGSLMYALPMEDADILMFLADKTVVHVLKLGEVWAQVSVEIEEGTAVTGYVEKAALKLIPTEEPLPAPKIWVTAETEEKQYDGKVYEGETLFLNTDISYYEGLVTIQWQYNTGDGEWHDIEGENNAVCPIVVTAENVKYYFRVRLTIVTED